MPIKFLEDIAIADVAFEATGQTLPDLFSEVGRAFYQITAQAEVPPSREDEFVIKGANLEDLLFNFVDELIFRKDANQLLYSDFKIEIKKTAEGHEASVLAKGAPISPEHQAKVDIKAATYHQFELKQLPTGEWYCRLVLDI